MSYSRKKIVRIDRGISFAFQNLAFVTKTLILYILVDAFYDTYLSIKLCSTMTGDGGENN